VSEFKGIPATAMAAKGGYAELSDDDVRATVAYMLARAGFQDRAAPVAAAPRVAPKPAESGNTAVDDKMLIFDCQAYGAYRVCVPRARGIA
jgi:hypothetical protein